MGKNLSNKYGQKLPDSAKKSTADAIKTGSKRALQKTAETSGELILNKTADKMFRKSLLKNYKMTKWKHKKKINISRKKDNKLLTN